MPSILSRTTHFTFSPAKKEATTMITKVVALAALLAIPASGQCGCGCGGWVHPGLAPLAPVCPDLSAGWGYPRLISALAPRGSSASSSSAAASGQPVHPGLPPLGLYGGHPGLVPTAGSSSAASSSAASGSGGRSSSSSSAAGVSAPVVQAAPVYPPCGGFFGDYWGGYGYPGAFPGLGSAAPSSSSAASDGGSAASSSSSSSSGSVYGAPLAPIVPTFPVFAPSFPVAPALPSWGGVFGGCGVAPGGVWGGYGLPGLGVGAASSASAAAALGGLIGGYGYPSVGAGAASSASAAGVGLGGLYPRTCY